MTTRTQAAPEASDRVAGFGATLRFELVKLLSPWRVRMLMLACVVGPAGYALVVQHQGALPSDTVFGRWMHDTGWAGALVLLAFCCSWVLPLAVPLVAGDVFASEDRLGTWRHLVVGVRSPARIFVAKALSALLLTVVLTLLLGLSAVLGSLAGAGNHVLVGLDGQQVAPGRAALLVALAWALAGVAGLAWAAVAMLCSVLFGRSPVSLLFPAMLALALQLATMLPLPLAVRMALPSEVFVSWRGLFTEHAQTRMVLVSLAVNIVWTLLALVLAWRAFLRRDFTQLANDGLPKGLIARAAAGLAGGALAVVVVLALLVHQQGGGITRPRVERGLATSFSHLYVLQTRELHRPLVSEQEMRTAASCDKGGDLAADAGPGNDWRCVVTWHIPGATATGNAIYQLDVAPDGRVVADGDGPTDVNGYFPVRTPQGVRPNPLWQVDGLVDLLASS